MSVRPKCAMREVTASRSAGASSFCSHATDPYLPKVLRIVELCCCGGAEVSAACNQTHLLQRGKSHYWVAHIEVGCRNRRFTNCLSPTAFFKRATTSSPKAHCRNSHYSHKLHSTVKLAQATLPGQNVTNAPVRLYMFPCSSYTTAQRPRRAPPPLIKDSLSTKMHAVLCCSCQ
jgi:hypothetical protein